MFNMIRLILVISIFFTLPLMGKSVYNLADLEVLVEDYQYPEFFEHALDIRPSERQEAWKTLVSKMGEAYAKTILSTEEIKRVDFLKIDNLYGWPGLKTNDVFRIQRQEIGLRYLKKCLKSQDPCWDDLRSFWEKDKNDADTAFKLSELVSSYKNSPFPSWPFLEIALKSPLSEFYCKKEFVMESLWNKIEMDYVKLGPKGDLMTKIDRTIHPDCVPSLVSEAKKRLAAPPKTFDREVAFQVLRSQSKASEELVDFFYTVYLLDNPSQGELFNYSWNRVRELSRSPSRREMVLNKLKSLDPLPDAILASLDQTKKKVILQHFKTHFPEFLDLYTDQCLEFYGGKRSFPTGNPTLNCADFMQSDLAPIVIDEFKMKKFEEVRKI